MTNRVLLSTGLVMVLATFSFAQTEVPAAGRMLVVVGAAGTPEYAATFSSWADDWRAAAAATNMEYVELGRDEDDLVRDRLKERIAESRPDSATPLWLILIGHGTFDRNVAKFNLRGPDVSAKEMQAWLGEIQGPMVVINSFSCSGAFLQDLRAKNRVVITATKSGAELNYSRFGGYLAESLGDANADLDHDDQVSLLEAFLFASAKVGRFYESESRLATEHALLDDNQDGKGTPADFFVGIRADSKSKGGARPDGRLAHRHILVPAKNAVTLTAEQRAERDRLEAEIDSWRGQKSALSEDAYFAQLEKLMVQLATLYEDATNRPVSN